MAEKFIEEIYQYAYITSRLREVVERYRYHEIYTGTYLFRDLVPGLESSVAACVRDEFEEAETLREKLYSVEHLTDSIYISDMLENTVIPIMRRWIQSWISVNEQMDSRYRIESTSSGFLTIKDTQSDLYLHSNSDPMEEARKIVENRFDYTKEAYVVWGCGLGYHAYQIYRISEGTIPITVYEPNPNLVRYALQYGVLAWIPKENLHIMPGYNGEEFLQNIQDSDGVFFLQPYVSAMPDGQQKRLLHKYISEKIIQAEEQDELDISDPDIQIKSYRYAYTISRLRQVIDYCRVMDERRARDLLQNLQGNIEEFVRASIEDGYAEGNELQEVFDYVRQLNDLVLLGDLLEESAIPGMERWMRCKYNAEITLDERYVLEATADGFWTIKDVPENTYLHSKQDPMDEARRLIKRQYNVAAESYAVWGCGLGYHVYQLYLISKGKAPLMLYETNPQMVQYARQYGVLSWIPDEKLKIVYVNDAKEFFANAKETQEHFFLAPYIETDEKKERKNYLKGYYSRCLFEFEARKDLLLNCYSNKRLGVPYVSKVDHTKLNKEMVVVGGGPSLDHYIDTLKSWQGKKTIIAAGTVWKKLLRSGIRPDFVVIMDPYHEVYQQIEDIEDNSATLLFTLQANWRVGKYYQGEKYLIPHHVFIRELNDCIEKEGETFYFSGGSVTVFELEFAMRMFADKVYLLGVDLSLPGGMTHAEGTANSTIVDTTDLIPMEDVNGNTVYTNHVLIGSVSWFELIMAETEGIEYINMSDVGVKLKGTRPYEGKPDKQ